MMDEINVLYIVDLLKSMKVLSIILIIVSVLMISVFVGLWCEYDCPSYKGIIVSSILFICATAAAIIIPGQEILEKVVETNNITLINNFYHYAYNGLRLIAYGVFAIYFIIKIIDVVSRWWKNRQKSEDIL